MLLSSCIFIDNSENMREAVWNYATLWWIRGVAHHSMGLTTTGLTIGKDSAVVAFQHRLDQRKCGLIIDTLLQRVCVVH